MTGQASAVSQGHAHAVLRKATRTLHASLDASRSGYVRYLLMNCPCTWIEPALTDAGIHRLLPDWDQRQRQLALAADLEALEVTPDPPRARIIEADAGTILGWSYVLEGSRLARIIHEAENFCDDSGGKRPIHVANRCSNELPRVSTLCHSHHDRRYAASVRSARRPPQETHRRFRRRQSIFQWRCTVAAGVGA